ncbi:hypothetical protein [Polluticoccus soli]|uniref:hypothetical protein n=1 Tax=Polluticoccus soli TaxID=3034150 RepID=UPI0023E2D057|nr:hypothetical protein [Flavipsychrobacter sp. JY13-12]
MKLLATERIDTLNFFLIILSAVMAIFMPFELFLFSYAIFGPLHYLTEVSWLHDKNYFTQNKYDYLYLVAIAGGISVLFLDAIFNFMDIPLPPFMASTLTWVGILLAILFVSVKKLAYRIVGIIGILILAKASLSQTMTVYLSVFLPTLIHVYVFTGLFMLYGALKSKSRMGLVSVALFAFCPFILLNLFPNFSFYDATDYAKRAYIGSDGKAGFMSMSIQTIHLLFGTTVTATTEQEANQMWLNHIFHSANGIVVARLVAFAYTYHYLNWFSKTKVIQWHKVPRLRFGIVIIAWLLSVALYAINFTMGLTWLFFLSMVHVLLELPLNAVSVMGIYSILKQRVLGKKEEVEVKVVKG